MNSQRRPRKLRWFQLALRDVLWLVVVCCMALAWWHDHWRLTDGADTSARELEERRADALRLREELIAASSKSKPQGLEGCSFGPAVSGRVVSTEPEKGVVEVSLGSDDGVQLGQTLVVYRFGTTLESTKYLGEIRLISVDKKKAIGRVLSNAKGTIEADDQVATRLE